MAVVLEHEIMDQVLATVTINCRANDTILSSPTNYHDMFVNALHVCFHLRVGLKKKIGVYQPIGTWAI
jgi:hypothetical protein